MEDLIKRAYYDTKTGFISSNKLYQKLKLQGVTLKQISSKK